MSHRRRLAVLLLAALGLLAVPAATSAAPLDELGPSGRTGLGLGSSGRHLVCYAPGFATWVICIDYP